MNACLLGSVLSLEDWLALEIERFPELAECRSPSATALARVVVVRDRLTEIVDALLDGRPVPPAAVEALNAVQRAAPSFARLSIEDGGFATQQEHLGESDGFLAACLAGAAAELLASEAIGKLRQCQADDCRMVFLLSHPKRRWCSAERCGNRVRVARYYPQNRKNPH